MADPTEPGWRPEYTGDTSLGNVGTGSQFGVDLYYLYRAGRNELPEVAGIYSALTSQVHQTAGHMRALFDVPGVGMHTAHLRLLELRDHAHEVLRLTSLRMLAAGEALVTIAGRYAATDQAAACAFVAELDRVEDPANKDPAVKDVDAQNWPTQPPIVLEPPEVGDPAPVRPVDDGHLAPEGAE